MVFHHHIGLAILHHATRAAAHDGDPLVAVPGIRRRHGDDRHYHFVGERPPRRTRTLPLSFTWHAMPTRRRHTHQPQHLRLSRSRRWRLNLEFGRNHGATFHTQPDWPESFFKIRLAIVYSPIT